jgi:hypothetical protein
MGVESLEGGGGRVVEKDSGSVVVVVVVVGRIVRVIAAWVWEWEELGRDV